MRGSILLVAAALAGACLAGPAHAQITEVIGPKGIAAGGIAPGATVVGFAVAQDVHDGFVELWRRDQVLVDDDRDGVVLWDVPKVPDRSVWVSIDAGTGGSAATSPDGIDLPESPWPGGGPIPDPTAKPHVEAVAQVAELLWVRPGVGAWGATAGDGSLQDFDGEVDGTVWVVLKDFLPIPPYTVPPPELAQNGDVFVGIDRETLAWSRFVIGSSAVRTSVEVGR